MTRPTELQTISETTGLQSLGQAAARSIGQLRGAGGSGLTPSAPATLPAAIAEAAQRADPRAVDESLLACWPPSLKRLATWAVNGDFERTGIKFGDLAEVPAQDIRAALALTERCLQPTPEPFIVKHFTKCALATKAKAENVADIQARAVVFVEDLAEFPADVIAEAFKFWRRTEKFSPSVADIRERCWRLASARYTAKRALENELRHPRRRTA
jgi:hypothetical protein